VRIDLRGPPGQRVKGAASLEGRSTGMVGRSGFALGRAHIGATAWCWWAPGEKYNACSSSRVPPLRRGGQRAATAWRLATRSAGVAAAAEAASSIRSGLREATGAAATGVARTRAGSVPPSAQARARRPPPARPRPPHALRAGGPRAVVIGIGRGRGRRRAASPRRSPAVEGAVDDRAGGGAPLAVGEGERVGRRGAAGRAPA